MRKRPTGRAANARTLRVLFFDTAADTPGTSIVRTLYRFFDDNLAGRGEPATLRYGMTGDPFSGTTYAGYCDLQQLFPTQTGSARPLGSMSSKQKLPQSKAGARRSVQSVLVGT